MPRSYLLSHCSIGQTLVQKCSVRGLFQHAHSFGTFPLLWWLVAFRTFIKYEPPNHQSRWGHLPPTLKLPVTRKAVRKFKRDVICRKKPKIACHFCILFSVLDSKTCLHRSIKTTNKTSPQKWNTLLRRLITPTREGLSLLNTERSRAHEWRCR